MKQLKLKNFLSAAVIAALLSSCSKDKIIPDPIDPIVEKGGVYVLNQGNFNANNSTLSFYDYLTKTTTANRFNAVNGTELGDTGNDVKIYGSKMYILVNVSSTIEVVDPKTTKSIKQIRMFEGENARKPRFIVFNKNKAFITTYDGNVAVLDTASLTVDKLIKVGRNPEQMVIANGKLYVANSGGLDSFTEGIGPDKSVSVIDLNTLTEIKKITVPINPINISADAFGDVYVISYGTDFPSKPFLTVIDDVNDVVKSSNSIDAGYATQFVINGDVAYYITDAGKIKVYNVKTETVAADNFITDGTAIKTPFSIAYDDTTGEIFVTDAKDYKSNGQLFAFDKNGTLEKDKGYPVNVGINPGAIVLVSK